MALLKSKTLFACYLFCLLFPIRSDALLQTQPERAESSNATTLETTLSGSVACDSNPLSDATLFVFQEKLLASATTDQSGEFEVKLERRNIAQKLLEVFSPNKVHVLVVASGKVAQLRTLKTNEAGELKFDLQHQEKPLQGRIIDNQGIGVDDAELRIVSLNDGKSAVNIPTVIEHESLQTKTGDQGLFQFNGLTTTMLGSISVTGPGLVPAFLSPDSFNEDPVLVAQPGRTVRGKVLDGLNQSAVSDVSVSVIGSSQRVAVDEQGAFEITGLPAFQPLRLRAAANGKQAYLPSTIEVPIEQGFAPIEVKFSLERAVWANCKVSDFGTVAAQGDQVQDAGGPAAAEVFYFPTPENDKFQTYVNLFLAQGQAPSISTDASGKARLVALSGPGVVIVSAPGFPPNESVNSLNDQQRAMVQGVVGGRELTAVSWIEVESVDDEPQVNIWVSKGRSIEVELVGSELEPEENLVLHRAESKVTYRQSVTGSRFMAEQFQPGETRQVLVHAPSKQLGGILDIQAELKSPVQMELQPTGSLAGRIVSKDGEPEAGMAIQFELLTDDGYRQVAAQLFTDANGRFHQRSLIAELKYRVAAIRLTGAQRAMSTDAPKMDSQWYVAKDLQINSGELVDLGELVLGSTEAPDPKRSPQTSEPIDVATERSLPTQFAGKVSRRSGGSLAGAVVTLNTWPDRTGDLLQDVELSPTVLAQSISDANGNFQLNIDEGLETNLMASTIAGRGSNVALVVVAEKMGAMQIPLKGIVNPTDLKIALSREMIVRGKISSPDGPLQVRLSPDSTMKVYSADSVGMIIERLKAGMDLEQASEKLQEISTLDPLLGGIDTNWKTNENGIFLVRNIPLNAIFDLHAVGPNGLQQTITVVSRPLSGFEYKSSGSDDVKQLSGSRIRMNLNRDGE